MQANALMLTFITDFNLMNTSLPEIGTFRIYFSQYYYGFPSLYDLQEILGTTKGLKIISANTNLSGRRAAKMTIARNKAKTRDIVKQYWKNKGNSQTEYF